MTDVVEDVVTQTPEEELEALRARADLLGISYRGNTGAAKLRELIAAQLETNTENKEQATPREVAKRKRDEAAKLVRLRVACMNPMKREWQGELITCGNSVVGTFSKYVPFGVDWHVPNIIYKMMKERQYQVFVTKVNDRGQKYREGVLQKEYSIDVLPPLTQAELKNLAQRQAMTNGTSAD